MIKGNICPGCEHFRVNENIHRLKSSAISAIKEFERQYVTPIDENVAHATEIAKEDMIHFCAENEDAINARKRVRDLETQCAGERKRLKELRVMNNKLYSIKCMMNQAHAEAEGLN